MNGALNLHPKVAGGSLAGALGILIDWIFTLTHVHATPPVSGAIVLLLCFLGGWLAPMVAPPSSSAPKG